MAAPLPPLSMRPLLLDKIWGGQRLRRLKGAPSSMPNVGESWEIADLPEGQSAIVGGPFAGATLGELVRAHGPRLIGSSAREDRFPLLVKLIDADDRLSVQVHPGADYAAAHPGCFSKDEAWLVVEAEPGAAVLHGFVEGVTPASFARAIAEGRADALLRRVEVKVGDAIRVPPGTVHAIGPGLTLLELQEPSDTTFRVFDYGRLDAAGRPRALHVEAALEVARFGEQPPALHPTREGDRGLGRAWSPSYRMDELELDGGAREVSVGLASPLVVFALEGEIELVCDGAVTSLSRAHTVLVPPREGAVTLRSARARAILMSLG